MSFASVACACTRTSSATPTNRSKHLTAPANPPVGFLNVDKPLGMTSHDVVAKVRRAAGTKKVGHAGTLDPLATGVLIVCVGAATRLSDFVMHATKRYTARVRLGEVTTTYDREGEVVQVRDASHITLVDVDAVLPRFLGVIEQVPPMYSAIKQGGRKLYDLARAGETVERAPRRVRIDALRVIDWDVPIAGLSDRYLPVNPPEGAHAAQAREFTLDVTCSAGTYIRSLAYDIGEALGVGAHLAGLVRTASGRVFTLENATPLDTLLSDPAAYIISPAQALADFPSLTLDDAALTEIRYGRAIVMAGANDVADGTLYMAYDAAGGLVAVLEAKSGRLKPQKVLQTDNS